MTLRRTLLALLALLLFAVACGPAQDAPAAPLNGAAGRSLDETWATYKHEFIQNGQVRDLYSHQTTSEGQGYGMLRAVWMDDRTQFDALWSWTRTHLQARDDQLFAWLWGQGQDHKATVLSPSGASDADQDIALALVLASRRWHRTDLEQDARAVLGSIWTREVVQVGGQPYMTAGDWAKGPEEEKGDLVINPSYLEPYAYPLFATVDPAHPWKSLVTTSYRVLERCTFSPLSDSKSVGLPPNWCALDGRSGSAKAAHSFDHSSYYGYDAFRVMWRVALDYQWTKSAQARSYLERTSYLREQWRAHGRLLAIYQHNGEHGGGATEDPIIYGGDIGNFVVTDPSASDAVLHQKLLPSQHRQGSATWWGDRKNYFQQNWVWFGVALATGVLSDYS